MDIQKEAKGTRVQYIFTSFSLRHRKNFKHEGQIIRITSRWEEEGATETEKRTGQEEKWMRPREEDGGGRSAGA